jgi:hypothetical protein
MKAHELISRACGEEPRGFIAPAWATSPALLRVLARNQYLYDTSQFSSYLMWLIALKLWWNFRGDPRQKAMIQRKDWLHNLFGKIHPFRVYPDPTAEASPNGMIILPLPVIPFLRLPCWHTFSFFLPTAFYEWVLHRALKAEYF